MQDGIHGLDGDGEHTEGFAILLPELKELVPSVGLPILREPEGLHLRDEVIPVCRAIRGGPVAYEQVVKACEDLCDLLAICCVTLFKVIVARNRPLNEDGGRELARLEDGWVFD